jgi:hypothetical protein
MLLKKIVEEKFKATSFWDEVAAAMDVNKSGRGCMKRAKELKLRVSL